MCLEGPSQCSPHTPCWQNILIPTWGDIWQEWKSSQFGLHIGGDFSWISLETKGRRGSFQHFKVLLPGVCDRSRERSCAEAFKPFEKAGMVPQHNIDEKMIQRRRKKRRRRHLLRERFGLLLQHMGDLGLAIKLELQLPAYATTTATQDLSYVCNLCFSLQQRWVLNTLRKAQDWTCILTDTSWMLNSLSHSRNSR